MSKVQAIAISEQTKDPMPKVVPLVAVAVQSEADLSSGREESIREKPPYQAQNTESVRQHKEVSPGENLLLHQVQNKQASPPVVNKIWVNKEDEVPTTYQFKENNILPDQSRGIILSYMLKGKPLDAPHTTKPSRYQGYTVSRSKPFEEG